MSQDLIKVGVLGLGYVGLPLALEFSKVTPVVAYDVNSDRVSNLKDGIDKTLEVDKDELKSLSSLSFTSSIEDLRECNFYIVTVPTPIDSSNQPDLSPLLKATSSIAKILSCGDIVVYESTVYPGATEEECAPILESESGLKLNKDFFLGYSPERINPGDKNHSLTNIVKVTSGSNAETARKVDSVYKKIIKAGTYMAPSIKIAEAAKVIENTQRDVNIALINELALIFNLLELDTEEVLKAAETKWNFISFRPGLVGGHCIGVDPYYLTHKAQSVGYNPEVILAGRKLNDGMGSYVANQLSKFMMSKMIDLRRSHILIMGLTFKENCPDIRNSKVPSIAHALDKIGAKVSIYDPWIDQDLHLKDLNLISHPKEKDYDAIILAVPHTIFKELGIEKIKSYAKEKSVIYDLKYMFNASDSDIRL